MWKLVALAIFVAFLWRNYQEGKARAQVNSSNIVGNILIANIDDLFAGVLALALIRALSGLPALFMIALVVWSVESALYLYFHQELTFKGWVKKIGDDLVDGWALAMSIALWLEAVTFNLPPIAINF